MSSSSPLFNVLKVCQAAGDRQQLVQEINWADSCKTGNPLRQLPLSKWVHWKYTSTARLRLDWSKKEKKKEKYRKSQHRRAFLKSKRCSDLSLLPTITRSHMHCLATALPCKKYRVIVSFHRCSLNPLVLKRRLLWANCRFWDIKMNVTEWV